MQPPEGISIDVSKWISGDPKHSYSEWLRRVPAKKTESSSAKPLRKVNTKYKQEQIIEKKF